MGARDYVLWLGFLLFFLGACSETRDAIDAVNAATGVPRKRIDVSRMGVNAFANESQFGTVCEQYADIKNTLGLKFVRVLFNWNDGVQGAPQAQPNFSFYDEIIRCIPSGMDALPVLNGFPSWMRDSAHWIEGNPRAAFVDLWVKKVVRRYRGAGRVIGWQIWNEPNMKENPENVFLGLSNSPENYVEMLARAYSVVQDIAPGKLVVGAATTAIAQDFPDTLRYNRTMRDAGAENFLDVWAVHYYGSAYENVVRPDGSIKSFLNELRVPIWVTESGERGVAKQLEYVERTWPFLSEEVPGIKRFYYYSYASGGVAADEAYGLRTDQSQAPFSDLYIYLRDQKKG